MIRGPGSAVYTARRAAALAGVPERTVYYWAETGLVVPSVSRQKTMLWSYADLLVLRLVEWLRSDKPNLAIPRTSMARIRRELDRASSLGEELMKGIVVHVNGSGRLVFEGHAGLYVHLGKGFVQDLVPTKVNLIEVFQRHDGVTGPDLVRPRPTLRIVPGKLSGEPHVEDTRIPTTMLAALSARGLEAERIQELYPMLEPENIAEALDLEVQLGTLLAAA